MGYGAHARLQRARSDSDQKCRSYSRMPTIASAIRLGLVEDLVLSWMAHGIGTVSNYIGNQQAANAMNRCARH